MIWLVPLERIESRYTTQWATIIPEQIKAQGKESLEIEGDRTYGHTTPGAFLDFIATNKFKAKQIEGIASIFQNDVVQDGDRFLFYDAWHPAIISLRYMAELTGKNIEIHAIWHAGSYDSTDILGTTLKGNWGLHFEQALYGAIDFNYFGSYSHRSIFCNGLDVSNSKCYVSGQPHNAILAACQPNVVHPITKSIVFPHRLSPDKNVDLWHTLEPMLQANGWTTFATQSWKLNKEQYYEELRKYTFSLSLSRHENFGIANVEAVMNGVIPIVPNHGVHQEFYPSEFRYPTGFWDKPEMLVQHMENCFKNAKALQASLHMTLQPSIRKRMTADVMFKELLR